MRDSHPASEKFRSPTRTFRPHAPLRPPDLIIQDELHLIAGPLGTLVGLYETAVDHLATWQVGGQSVRPKVIAATATIRRAEQQVEALFLRRVTIFPPQGLDVEDNFFSRQRPPSREDAGRPLYRHLRQRPPPESRPDPRLRGPPRSGPGALREVRPRRRPLDDAGRLLQLDERAGWDAPPGR